MWGKSSLMNRLVEQKLSIVTPLAQTTRERCWAIDTRDGVQMVFVDTPGLVDPRYLLHRDMPREQATPTSSCLLIDAARGRPEFRDELLALAAAARRSCWWSPTRSTWPSPEQREAVRAGPKECAGAGAVRGLGRDGEGSGAARARWPSGSGRPSSTPKTTSARSRCASSWPTGARDHLRAAREGGPVQRGGEGGGVPRERLARRTFARWCSWSGPRRRPS